MARKKNSSRRNAKSSRGATVTQEPAAQPVRLALIDALRGIAIALMFAYHFSFDLNYFGVLHQNFNDDPFWLTARSVILGSFAALVGVSLALATGNGIQWRAYLRRLGLLAACAATVSIGSYYMFPASWISFGVLHFIAVASVLALVFVRWYWANLAIGCALIAIGATVTSPVFDAPILNWFGLMTHKPVTEDYVPLLPWFGVVLIGIFAGRLACRGAPWVGVSQWKAGAASRPLAWAGRHSLILYMVHQPVFLGVLYLLLGRRN